VYEVSLLSPVRAGAPHVAAVAKLFSGNATALALNGSHAGHNVTLALTDPDSSEVVPTRSPKFGGDFMLDSQGDQELIFYGPGGSLRVLHLTASVDDSAWPTTQRGHRGHRVRPVHGGHHVHLGDAGSGTTRGSGTGFTTQRPAAPSPLAAMR
jgi:hypothetical protein